MAAMPPAASALGRARGGRHAARAPPGPAGRRGHLDKCQASGGAGRDKCQAEVRQEGPPGRDFRLCIEFLYDCDRLIRLSYALVYNLELLTDFAKRAENER